MSEFSKDIKDKIESIAEKGALTTKKINVAILEMLNFWGFFLLFIGLIGVLTTTVLFMNGADDFNFAQHSTLIIAYSVIIAVFSIMSISGGYFQGYNFAEREDEWLVAYKEYKDMFIKTIKKRKVKPDWYLITEFFVKSIITKILPIALNGIAFVIGMEAMQGINATGYFIFNAVSTITFTIGGALMATHKGYKQTLSFRIDNLKQKIENMKEEKEKQIVQSVGVSVDIPFENTEPWIPIYDISPNKAISSSLENDKEIEKIGEEYDRN